LKNLCEHEESPIKDGICTICSKPAPWHRLNQSVDVSQTDSSTAGGSGGSQVMQGIPVRDSSIDERLKTASEKVIKISSVFSSLGSVLNIANHVLAVLLLCATFALSSSIENGALALLAGIGLTMLVWGIGWIQVALLRGLSSFFLMRGLAHLKSVSGS
jgi:hypothetical protein